MNQQQQNKALHPTAYSLRYASCLASVAALSAAGELSRSSACANLHGIITLKYMISPMDFVRRWNEFKAAEPALIEDDDFVLQVARPEDLQDKDIPALAKQFLLESGLPKSCAPFISFSDIGEGLKRVWEVYSPYSWKEEEKQSLKSYLLIGSDGEGNPMCIDASMGGQIVVLDHEDNFSVWQFVNSSVMQLAECLLVYNAPTPRKDLESIFAKIDTPSVQTNAFWWQTLRNDED